ncbi:MAG: LmbU family transcriptional regulator [Streptosporangiaceae bacterium]
MAGSHPTAIASGPALISAGAGSPAIETMPFFLPRRGLQLPTQLPFEKWLTIGRRLSEVCTLSAWCLGDWLVYGEAAYTGRYREAIEQTSLDYQTLRNYAWVARRFSLPRRREVLSFGHHTEVAALPEAEQDFWLRKAEELGWSVKRLRNEVRTSHKERSLDRDDEQRTDSDRAERELLVASVEIQITSDQLGRCQAAAERVGLSIEEWAASVLDKAARYALDPKLTRQQ